MKNKYIVGDKVAIKTVRDIAIYRFKHRKTKGALTNEEAVTSVDEMEVLIRKEFHSDWVEYCGTTITIEEFDGVMYSIRGGDFRYGFYEEDIYSTIDKLKMLDNEC